MPTSSPPDYHRSTRGLRRRSRSVSIDTPARVPSDDPMESIIAFREPRPAMVGYAR